MVENSMMSWGIFYILYSIFCSLYSTFPPTLYLASFNLNSFRILFSYRRVKLAFPNLLECFPQTVI